MNRNLTPLAALAAAAGPQLPLFAVGLGLAALAAWALSDYPPAPKAPVPGPDVPALPPPDTAYPRHLSGKFASQVLLSDLRAVFAAGPLTRAEAVATLTRRTGCSRSAAYHVLSRRLAVFLAEAPDGRLALVE